MQPINASENAFKCSWCKLFNLPYDPECIHKVPHKCDLVKCDLVKCVYCKFTVPIHKLGNHYVLCIKNPELIANNYHLKPYQYSF